MPKNIKDVKGPTALEYVLMVVGIAIAIIAVVKLLGTDVKTSPDSAAKNVGTTIK
jgi:Flp pilus assembly pilin Flp